MRRLLAEQHLVVTAGAGGVGKTTIAAAMAVQAARQGRRVAVLTIDPARRLADALGLDELTGTLRAVDPALLALSGGASGGALSAMMLDVKTTGDQMIERFSPDEAAAAAIRENPYYRYFSSSLAGTQEYMAVAQVYDLLQDGRFDLVVLDTPPARHALDFLEAPDRLIGALDSRSMQLLRRAHPREGGMGKKLASQGRALVLRSLSRMTGGSFIEDLAGFLSVFSTILDALQASSEGLKGMLRHERTSFCVVTSPTHTNVSEALAFRKELEVRGFPFGAFVCNRVHAPCHVPGGEAEIDGALHAALPELSRARRVALGEQMLHGVARHNAMASYDARALRRLREASDDAPVVVPLMPTDVHDLTGLVEVGEHLMGELL